MPKFFDALRSHIWKTRLEREMEEEIAFHLFMREREGLAASQARQRFGNTTLIQEQAREMHTFRFLESVEQDVRYAWRGLRRSPGFTAIAVLSLALGIGANTAIFSVTNAILLRLLPVDRPEQLRALSWESGPKLAMNNINGQFDDDMPNIRKSNAFSYPAYEYLREHNAVFEDMFAFKRCPGLTAIIAGRAERLQDVEMVSGNFYRGLGLRPELGRALTPGDDNVSAPPVAILSDSYWRRRFGGKPEVLGAAIRLNTHIYTVIGVNPAAFTGFAVGQTPDVFVPLSAAQDLVPDVPMRDPEMWSIQVMGRSRPGLDDRQGAAALTVALQQAVLAQLPKKTQADLPKVVLSEGGRNLNRGQFVIFIDVLTGTVGLVLLIACANLANLLLARATARSREIAVRMALGAGRRRVIRQILTESLMLSIMGGSLGMLIGYWGKDVIPHMVEEGWNPDHLAVPFDHHVLLFTAAVSVVAALVFGLVPALRATGPEVSPALKAGGRSASQTRQHLRLGKLLAGSQIALSILLLAGAGLFARTLFNLRAVPPGFNPENLLLASLDPPQERYAGERRAQFFHQALERVRAIPGVIAATEAMPLLANDVNVTAFVPTGHKKTEGEDDRASVNSVESDYFRTMGIAIVAGRAIDARDTAASPLVAVINRTLAKKAFPGRNPLGETFNDGQIQIVGISADARYSSLREGVPPSFYTAQLQQKGNDETTLHIRTAANPLTIANAVRVAVAKVDPDVPVYDIRTQTQQIDATLARERMLATLTGAFSSLALLLACIGIYGSMAYAVARRTNEIGIRMALGAKSGEVLGMIVRETVILATVGVVAGLALALAASRITANLLFGLKPNDPGTLAGAAAVMLFVAAAAGWVPARRAARVDPTVALREE